jgi:dihydroorotate dehydrogenase (NAD+) catalytic subunit
MFRVGPARFRNRVFLASGPAGYGTEYVGLIQLERLGGVVTKTITNEPRAGNPGRRIWETSAGLLNSIGLENVGAERFFAEKMPSLLDAGARVIVSLGAEDWKDYRLLLAAAADAGIDAVEINLSCPNVDRGGMIVGSDPALVSAYVRAAREALPRAAVIAKLTPNVADISELARAAVSGGAHAVTAINTIIGMDLSADAGRPVFRRIHAGLSGPAIFPVALDAVWRIARAVDIPVFASGGISTVDDARKMYAAGAAAVQIGTAIFYDPDLPERIVDELPHSGPRRPGRRQSNGGSFQ